LVLVFDLDGVVYLGDTPLPGAIESLNRLADEGHALYFLTNNSTRARVDYSDKLTAMGLPTHPEQVMTSAFATALYLKEQGASGKSVYVVGERGLAAELTAIGMRVLTLDDADKADYVVAGLDRGLTYAKLQRAHEEITVNGATFVATNRDATYPMERGEIPGGGAIVAPIECSTGVKGVTIGKPEPHAWQRILALAGVDAAEALMVGDRPETDIMGAKQLGMDTVLVLTGVTTPPDLPHLPAEQLPDNVLPDLTHLPELVRHLTG
jgi:phosphoglycolate/pyridoxal phosphate phosphatase family enzyme